MAADNGLTFSPTSIATVAIAERQIDFCISLFSLTNCIHIPIPI